MNDLGGGLWAETGNMVQQDLFEALAGRCVQKKGDHLLLGQLQQRNFILRRRGDVGQPRQHLPVLAHVKAQASGAIQDHAVLRIDEDQIAVFAHKFAN